MYWDGESKIIKNLNFYKYEKEVEKMKIHLLNYQTVSIFFDIKSYENIISLIDKSIGSKNCYVIDGSDEIEKFSNTKITDSFENVREPNESDFYDCMNVPCLIVKGCENIHPYLLDVLDCSLLKGMVKYKFSGVDEKGEHIDGRKEKRRLFGNRKVIFLTDLEQFFVKYNGLLDVLPDNIQLKFNESKPENQEDAEKIAQELYHLSISDLDNDENESSKPKPIISTHSSEDYIVETVPDFWYKIENEVSEKYKKLSHINNLYSNQLFYSSSSFGSLSPYVLYIDNNFSENITETDKRNSAYGLIEPVYNHIKRQKNSSRLKVVHFASKHRNTYFLEFLYNVAEIDTDGYYKEPEYVLVRTKVSNFAKKEYKNNRSQLKKGLCIYTKGELDLVVEKGELANKEDIKQDEVAGEDIIFEEKVENSKRGGKSELFSYIPDIRISGMKYFLFWRCRGFRLMKF